MEEAIQKLAELVSKSEHIVFFGGAGVSTESGIPDFRSVDGLYHQKYDYPPETILSHSFFLQRTKEFYDFYRDKMIYLDAKPNATHLKLATWEQQGKLEGIVTQNIDGLHQMAGNKKVYELHGSTYRNYCTRCHKFHPIEAILDSEGIPYCECGGIIKPDVVLYEEGLDDTTVTNAIQAISHADLMIVGGTSLSVYPAAGMLQYYQGNHLALINKSATPYDSNADILIQKGLGEVFAHL
ncbi:MAG: NAD-dependent protein deacylase [Butyribacter sp.]|nr:NAD-dependent protein deacylase [bacterium]MDY3853982.1 NAD-dependent protein deacylase [Butyribacter sp.]